MHIIRHPYLCNIKGAIINYSYHTHCTNIVVTAQTLKLTKLRKWTKGVNYRVDGLGFLSRTMKGIRHANDYGNQPNKKFKCSRCEKTFDRYLIKRCHKQSTHCRELKGRGRTL